MEQNRVSYSPRWFEQQDDPMVPSGQQHKFKGGYWEAKVSQDWGDLTKKKIESGGDTSLGFPVKWRPVCCGSLCAVLFWPREA